MVSQDGVWYATREEIKAELDVKETARSNARIGRALEDASRRIDGLMNRAFAPVLTTRYFDWPNFQYAYPWRIWFDQWELADIPTSVTSGGVTIPLNACNFEPVNSGPPYQSVELRRDLPYSFGVSSTPQRDVAITGLWGYRNSEATAGALVEVLDVSETGIDVNGATAAAVGVGSILRVDSERFIVTDRQQLDTGQTLAAGLTNQNNAVTVTVPSGAAFAAGETILIDSERILIEDIAGNQLTVRRAWDGSTIAAHTLGATIYAPRTLVVTRGALGTTAATHTNGASISVWQPPGPIRQLCVAETVTDLLQGRSGYARTAGSGENERETSGKGLADLRDSAYTAYGRKARQRSI
ncbi:hypothetical protein ACWDE0_22110 [Streptomyces sp. 900105755]